MCAGEVDDHSEHLTRAVEGVEPAGLPVWVQAYAALRTRLEHDRTPLGRFGIVPKQDAPADTRSYAPPR